MPILVAADTIAAACSLQQLCRSQRQPYRPPCLSLPWQALGWPDITVGRGPRSASPLRCTTRPSRLCAIVFGIVSGTCSLVPCDASACRKPSSLLANTRAVSCALPYVHGNAAPSYLISGSRSRTFLESAGAGDDVRCRTSDRPVILLEWTRSLFWSRPGNLAGRIGRWQTVLVVMATSLPAREHSQPAAAPVCGA